ncbi:MAG TPA: hypothetical protein VMT89_02325, partial [Candidatus Acidoferrales bacterium]|nr:hypothetical protein [Candidatus Acidoferrales bacterium]
MSTPSKLPPKMMLGFVVRRCANAIGHDPSAEELAAWANTYREDGRTVYLFGRPISVREAEVILKHPARPVSARMARMYEYIDVTASDLAVSDKVTSFAAAAARL